MTFADAKPFEGTSVRFETDALAIDHISRDGTGFVRAVTPREVILDVPNSCQLSPRQYTTLKPGPSVPCPRRRSLNMAEQQPESKPNAFDRFVRRIAAIPKAKVDALERAESKRTRGETKAKPAT